MSTTPSFPNRIIVKEGVILKSPHIDYMPDGGFKRRFEDVPVMLVRCKCHQDMPDWWWVLRQFTLFPIHRSGLSIHALSTICRRDLHKEVMACIKEDPENGSNDEESDYFDEHYDDDGEEDMRPGSRMVQGYYCSTTKAVLVAPFPYTTPSSDLLKLRRYQHEYKWPEFLGISNHKGIKRTGLNVFETNVLKRAARNRAVFHRAPLTKEEIEEFKRRNGPYYNPAVCYCHMCAGG